MNKYHDALLRLLNVSLHGGMKPGLTNSLKLNDLHHNPIDTFATIHVAGSNGKGSVCAKIAKAFELQGLKVGLYTSPHIASWRERISINGTMISEHDVTKHLDKLFSLIETHEIPATFFEISTSLAFLYFAEQNIDIAIIETGLGGRFDATNIITPILSVITSISLDHTEILGDTIDAIAYEKAGIIKQNVPVVIGSRVPKHIIGEVAYQQNSQCYVVDEPYANYLEENNAIARKALTVLQTPAAIIEKALEALPPCRLEYLPHQNVILDVAHNTDGLNQLFTAIKQRFPNKKLRCVTGLSKNKDLHECLKIIDKNASHIHLVIATNGRGAPCETLYNILESLGRNIETTTIEPTICEAVQNSIDQASIHHDLTVICGTFFIMHEARMSLGIHEPADPMDLNERLTINIK